jgi:hypothetical protein
VTSFDIDRHDSNAGFTGFSNASDTDDQDLEGSNFVTDSLSFEPPSLPVRELDVSFGDSETAQLVAESVPSTTDQQVGRGHRSQ